MDGLAASHAAQIGGARWSRLRMKGETVDEIAGAARGACAARCRSRSPTCRGRCVDTCGTGGDGARHVQHLDRRRARAAAAGVPVAKHGNRAVSSRAGSADVLEALGVTIDLDAGERRRARSTRSASRFLFAPALPPRDARRRAGAAASSASARSSTCSAR